MNPIKHIGNLLYLRKVNKDITIIKEDLRVALLLLNWSKHFYKKKDSNAKNLLASILRQVRVKNPYQVEGDSHNKAMYDAYFEMENHIPSFDVLFPGDFIIAFRDEYYYKKGYKYLSGSFFSHNRNYEVLRVRKDRYLESFNGQYGHFWVDEEYITMYRYANREEMAVFKSRQKQYKERERQIKTLQKQIEKLRKEQSKI